MTEASTPHAASRGARAARTALLVVVLAVPASRPGAAAVPPGPEPAPVVRIDSRVYVGANDLARLLDATKFWRSDLRKLVLRSGDHRIQLAVDLPFVLVDDRAILLPDPVRSRGGQVQVPVALLDSLPVDATLRRVFYEPRRDIVIALPRGGIVRSPSIDAGGDRVRISFPIERVTDVVVAGRARKHFQLRLGGFFSGQVPDSLAPGGLLRSMRPLAVPSGTAFEFDVAPEAGGYRIVREGSRVTLELVRGAGRGLDEFAPEGAAGPRAIRVVVLDPGHGGDDTGVTAGGFTEKDLALRLAQLLKPELERRMPVHVVLTRDRDVPLDDEHRAEAANRARADLVISLHFDGYPSSRARGATACVAPAIMGGDQASARPRWVLPVEILPWRDVALRHAVPARALAEAVRATLELSDQGPVRIRERLAAPLLGVNAPGILLECATLTSPDDRVRLGSQDGLTTLAASLADAIAAWQRNL